MSWVTENDALYRKVEIFVEDSTIFALTDLTIENTIKIRRKYKLKTPDAIIAATALVHKMTVVTDNDRDFANIKGLKIINPNHY